jgi:hypothetical protein
MVTWLLRKQASSNRRRSDGEIWLKSDLAAVVLDLVEQHRHEIDHRADARMPLQMVGHVGVILDRMQVYPRQHVLVAGMVAVVRLVHVPEKDQIEALVGHVGGASGFGGCAGRACPA